MLFNFAAAWQNTVQVHEVHQANPECQGGVEVIELAALTTVQRRPFVDNGTGDCPI